MPLPERPRPEAQPGWSRPRWFALIAFAALVAVVLALASRGAAPQLQAQGKAQPAPQGQREPPAHPAPPVAAEAEDQDVVPAAALPPEARQTLALVKRGGPFPHAKDGVVFGNHERLLPRRPRGYYTEYTVRTPGSHDRGPRRLVAGRGATGDPATSGEYWYTPDHYRTFARVQE